MKKQNESEYGKGLCYNLGLFLAHAERGIVESYSEDHDAEMWFNGASDHLFDLQVNSAPKNLRTRLKKFQENCIGWRGLGEPKPTPNDRAWATQEAKDLLRLIDKAHKVPTTKGYWE